MAGHGSIPYMTYPNNGVVPQTIAEWQTHVNRLLGEAAAPILDTTPTASGGLGHVPITTGRTLFTRFQYIMDRENDTSLLGRYFAGYNIHTFSAILSMPDDFIANNPSADPADTPCFADAQLLVQFRAFNCVQLNCNRNHRVHSWRNVTPEMSTVFVES